MPQHIARLLTSSIESIERLDVLLHLRADASHTFTARTIAAVLHLPVPSVEQHLAILCGRGFLTVKIASDLLYAYMPMSPSVTALLDELAALNRADVIAVLDAPDGKDSSRAFANALLNRSSRG